MPLPTPDHRWRASAVTGLADGAGVSSVPNEGASPNPFSLGMPTTASQPLWRPGSKGIGGQPAFSFDGADDRLDVVFGTIARTVNLTMLLVHQPALVGAPGQPAWMGGNELIWDSTPLHGQWAVNGLHVPVSAQRTPQYWLALYGEPPNESGLIINGDRITASTTYPALTASNTGFSIGGHGNQARPYPGLISECMIWLRLLTAAERYDVHDYCRTTYDIPSAQVASKSTPGAMTRIASRR